jgi:hypothetical protein
MFRRSESAVRALAGRLGTAIRRIDNVLSQQQQKGALL